MRHASQTDITIAQDCDYIKIKSAVMLVADEVVTRRDTPESLV